MRSVAEPGVGVLRWAFVRLREPRGETVTGRGEKQDPAELDLLHEVNAHVHEAAQRFEGVEPGEDRWEFRCECGAPECRVAVSLTLAEYEALRLGDRPVLAPGHDQRA
jgi:hypothetical protein